MPCRNRLMGMMLCCLAVTMLLAGPRAYGAEGDGITVQVGTSVANPGCTVEVPIELYESTFAPTTMILWIGYDPAQLTPEEDYYEIVVRDAQGDPVEDSLGNVVTERSGVRADFSLADTGKTMTTAYHPEAGAIAMSILGLGATQAAIPDGPLVTVAFRMNAAVSPGATATILGHDSENPVIVEEAERRSSASDAEGAITVTMRDGGVNAGCPAPDLPTNLTASQGGTDGVLLTWDAVNVSNVTYRVYRADSADLGSALPLGEEWTSDTAFLDITAEQGDMVGPDACNGGSALAGSIYHYWVASRSPFRCEQPPAGDSVTGYRGGGKALTAVSASSLRGQATVAVLLALLLGAPAWFRRTKRSS